MATLATTLIIYCIIFHAWVVILEMFLWTKPLGRKAFGTSVAEAETSKVLAANQGLYNGFLVAGLVLSYVVDSPATAMTLRSYVLCCIAAAGIYGGLTVKRTIVVVQGLPAMAALLLIHLS